MPGRRRRPFRSPGRRGSDASAAAGRGPAAARAPGAGGLGGGAGPAGDPGRVRPDRRRRAPRLALPRRRRAARARAPLRPHHRRAGLRRRARGAQHGRRARRGGDALGWDAILVGPGPGIIGSDTELGHGGMAALDSAHAALSLRLPTILSPRLSSSDPRERHRGLSHHTATVLGLLLAPVTVAVPEVGDDGAAELASQIETASGGRHHLQVRLGRPRRLRRLRPADDHDGPLDRRGPALLRRPARGRKPALSPERMLHCG